MAIVAPAAPPVTPKRSLGRRLGRVFIGALLCYLGVIVLLLLLENKLVFHPTAATEWWVKPPNDRVQDVELRSADGTRLHAWWCPAEGWTPEQGAVLYCHGNAGNLSIRGSFVADWQKEMGASVLIFDYPGFGKSDGSPTETGCYAAADAAYDWLVRTQHIPAERVVIFGKSLGGGVAVDLASRKPHRALVLMKTFTSMGDVAQCLYPWLPARWLVRNRFDSASKIASTGRPVFVTHGTLDTLVPYKLGRQLFAAAAEPKRFLPMEGIGHNDQHTPDFFPSLRSFLAEYAPLAQAAPSASAGN